ncbi:MAG: PDDEXK nuclease domain-containing protein [Iamia sp.]
MGRTVTNFERTLPPDQAAAATEVFKDPYVFDFLTLRHPFREAELEAGLVAHVERFLVELGQGFAFVGRQVEVTVGEDEFRIDLLFFHLRLRAYVVVELKAGKLRPEHTGQLTFYCTVVDEQVRHPDDQKTIGLLLCQSGDRRATPLWETGTPAQQRGLKRRWAPSFTSVRLPVWMAVRWRCNRRGVG